MIKDIVCLEPNNFRCTASPLRQKCAEVTSFDSDLHKMIGDLIDTMMSSQIAVGLAAPQIGYHFQVAVINLRQADSETIVLINPVVISTSGKKDLKKESCMSVPHFRGRVERRDKIVCACRGVDGKARQVEATGFLARVIAHEVDHLNGVLYLDKMAPNDSLEPVDFFR